MAFIKKKLIEEKVEEKPVETVVESTEDNLKNALLEIVADELSYVSKLNSMIAIAESSNKPDLAAALQKSRAKMKSNIAEIYSKGKKILGLVEEKEEEPKEEVTEVVDPAKVYDGEQIANIISDYTVDFLGTEAAEELEMISQSFYPNEDYTAEQIDAELNKYAIDPDTREAIETEISNLPDALEARKQEFKSAMDSDVAMLEELKDQFQTFAARERLIKLIIELKSIEHNGQPDTQWRVSDYGSGKGPIIA